MHRQQALALLLVVVLYATTATTAVEVRKCCALNERASATFLADGTPPECEPTLNASAFRYDLEFARNFALGNASEHVSVGRLNCAEQLEKFWLNLSEPLDAFEFDERGALVYDRLVFGAERYCVDVFGEDFGAYTCMEGFDDGISRIKWIGMIISIPFLLITFIVYVILDDYNIGKRCQTAYVFCLMCAYIFLVYIQFHSSLGKVTCLTLGSLCFYCFMSSFCWVNISCIDIFWTFSGKRGIQTRNSRNWKRFGCYMAYANGAPLLILAIVFGLNGESNKQRWFYPAFGDGKCWIGDGYPLLLYFYGPMGFLLTVNVVLFVFTMLKIRQHQRETKVLRSDESRRTYDQNKQMYQLFSKLIIAMGINWIFEFMSWCVDTILQDSKIEEIWIISDLCNALYGLVIFVLFICKRTIWISLKKKYYIFMGKPNMARMLSSGGTNTYQMSETEKTNVESNVYVTK